MTTDGTTLRTLSTLALASAALLAAGPAWAQSPRVQEPFAGLRPLAPAQMDGLRGGMMIGGIPVDFAVTVTTTVAGGTQAPVGLQTTLAIDNAGGIGAAATIPVGLPQAVTAGAGGGLTLSLGGNTSLAQRVTRNQIQTLVSNAANNLTVTHATDIQVTLPKFLAANRLFNAQAAAARMGIQSALVGIGH